MVIKGTSAMKVLDKAKLEWRMLETGDTDAVEFFKGGPRIYGCRSWAKIMQVNSEEVYLVAGSEHYLLAREVNEKYYWMKNCFKVNIHSGELQVMAPMLQARYENMAACHMGAHIYVIGGLD